MTFKYELRLFSIRALRMLLHVFYVFPLKKNKIIFSAFGGSKIACSPYYVYKLFVEKHPSDYEIYWVSKSNDRDRARREDKILEPRGLKFLYHLLTSAVIVDNDGFQSYIPIRKKQLYINTWHGGGLFKTAYGGSRSEEEITYGNKIKELEQGSIKVMVSTSALWTKVIARYRFGYKGEMLECGYPRNDIFFHDGTSVEHEVKKKLEVDVSTKLVLFAPTYRGGMFARFDGKTVESINVSQLTESLEKRFGGKFRFIYRGHHAAMPIVLNDDIIDGTNYPDMQELMVAADVFISDYSSCLWDFSLTKKPCLIFAPDFDEYAVDPGFESDYKEWPFPIAKNNKELTSIILNLDEDQNKRNIEKYHKDYGSFEEGHATEKVIQLIEQRAKL